MTRTSVGSRMMPALEARLWTWLLSSGRTAMQGGVGAHLPSSRRPTKLDKGPATIRPHRQSAPGRPNAYRNGAGDPRCDRRCLARPDPSGPARPAST